MSYVAKHTSVPVPRVQRACASRGITYIVMDVVSGIPLDFALPRIPRIGSILISQLRELTPSREGVATSVVGGPLRDNSRIGLEHDTILDEFSVISGEEPVLNSHRWQYETKSTHGDLAPRNITVKKDGTVTIDWDSAVWFPGYWEYTKANFTPHEMNDWISRIWEITGNMMSNLQEIGGFAHVDLTKFELLSMAATW